MADVVLRGRSEPMASALGVIRKVVHLNCARHLREAGSDALAVAAHAREAITPGDEAVALLLADAAGPAGCSSLTT